MLHVFLLNWTYEQNNDSTLQIVKQRFKSTHSVCRVALDQNDMLCCLAQRIPGSFWVSQTIKPIPRSRTRLRASELKISSKNPMKKKWWELESWAIIHAVVDMLRKGSRKLTYQKRQGFTISPYLAQGPILPEKKLSNSVAKEMKCFSSTFEPQIHRTPSCPIKRWGSTFGYNLSPFCDHTN